MAKTARPSSDPHHPVTVEQFVERVERTGADARVKARAAYLRLVRDVAAGRDLATVGEAAFHRVLEAADKTTADFRRDLAAARNLVDAERQHGEREQLEARWREAQRQRERTVAEQTAVIAEAQAAIGAAVRSELAAQFAFGRAVDAGPRAEALWLDLLDPQDRERFLVLRGERDRLDLEMVRARAEARMALQQAGAWEKTEAWEFELPAGRKLTADHWRQRAATFDREAELLAQRHAEALRHAVAFEQVLRAES